MFILLFLFFVGAFGTCEAAIKVDYGDQVRTVEACADSLVEVNWVLGYHNIEEYVDGSCDNLGTGYIRESTYYNPTSSPNNRNYEFGAQPGETRYFRCSAHCGNARFSVTCTGVCDGNAVEDCAGVCGGTAVEDCAGVCGGTAVEDCAGVCGGTAVVGGCDNVCGSTAVEDCAGVCGGTAVEDCAGVCNGDGSSCTCDENQYVSNHTCKNCSMLTRKKAGGLISGEDTSCIVKDWVTITASALGGAVVGVGGVVAWFTFSGNYMYIPI